MGNNLGSIIKLILALVLIHVTYRLFNTIFKASISILPYSLSSRSMRSTRNILNITANNLKVYISNDINLVKLIQIDQLRRARIELFGDFSATDYHGGNNLDFYTFSYGAVDLFLNEKRVSKNKFSNLVYYRILKSGNDNIRTILFNYANWILSRKRKSFNVKSIIQCVQNSITECSNSLVHYLNPTSLKFIKLSSKMNRFPFTFVRNPINRFISAVTEIDYRISIKSQDNSVEAKLIQSKFKNPIGSYLRFEEYINMILSYGGSNNIYNEHENIEIFHLSPMIGTFLLANKVENKNISIYYLEDFDNEWNRLSNDTNKEQLNNIYKLFNNSKIIPHETSSDPFKTSLTAKSFLSYASNDIYQYMKNTTVNFERLAIPDNIDNNIYEEEAKKYLISICRIYLIDFIYTKYELPKDCSFILNDAKAITEAYLLEKKKKYESVTTILDEIILYTPFIVKKIIAYFYCFTSSSYECAVRITHSHEFKNEQDDPETESYDEL